MNPKSHWGSPKRIYQTRLFYKLVFQVRKPVRQDQSRCVFSKTNCPCCKFHLLLIMKLCHIASLSQNQSHCASCKPTLSFILSPALAFLLANTFGTIYNKIRCCNYMQQCHHLGFTCEALWSSLILAFYSNEWHRKRSHDLNKKRFVQWGFYA